jgi:hypothetical protein
MVQPQNVRDTFLQFEERSVTLGRTEPFHASSGDACRQLHPRHGAAQTSIPRELRAEWLLRAEMVRARFSTAFAHIGSAKTWQGAVYFLKLRYSKVFIPPCARAKLWRITCFRIGVIEFGSIRSKPIEAGKEAERETSCWISATSKLRAAMNRFYTCWSKDAATRKSRSN